MSPKLKKLRPESQKILSNHPFDLRVNYAFSSKLTPIDSTAAYKQNGLRWINLKEDITIEIALKPTEAFSKTSVFSKYLKTVFAQKNCNAKLQLSARTEIPSYVMIMSLTK